MREIKFRGFDTETKAWLEPLTPIELIELGNSIDLMTKAELSHWKNKVILIQYTGLKDKNGKEIYEGDVVGGYPHGDVQVRWCNEYACFEAYWIDEEYDEGGNLYEKERTSLFANELMDCKDSWEVIGNIYENPNLLK